MVLRNRDTNAENIKLNVKVTNTLVKQRENYLFENTTVVYRVIINKQQYYPT